MNVVDINLLEKEINLARRYLQQVGSTIALVHQRNMLENVKLPKINNTNCWKSSVLPKKATTTTKGVLYRSRLSLSNKAPVQDTALPEIHYQKFCQPKSVHLSDTELALVVDKSQPKVTQDFDTMDILPPIKRQPTYFRLRRKRGQKPNADKCTREASKNVKWDLNCSCTRCKLMKNDYNTAKDHYNQWGNYPCVPDSIINRDDERSSAGSARV